MTIPQLTDAQRLAAGKKHAAQLGIKEAAWDNLLQRDQQYHINCGTNIALAAIEAGKGEPKDKEEV